MATSRQHFFHLLNNILGDYMKIVISSFLEALSLMIFVGLFRSWDGFEDRIDYQKAITPLQQQNEKHNQNGALVMYGGYLKNHVSKNGYVNKHFLDALQVVEARGFIYKVMVMRVKDRFVLGQYSRGLTEHWSCPEKEDTKLSTIYDT